MKNVEIEKYINKEDDNFLKNSCFPAHYVSRFIQFHVLMKQNQSPCPFVIMNTEMAGEEGEKRWSFLDLDPPEQLFLFNSD